MPEKCKRQKPCTNSHLCRGVPADWDCFNGPSLTTKGRASSGQTEFALLSARKLKDADFLMELRDRMLDGFSGDVCQRDYALKMANDWIDELTGT